MKKHRGDPRKSEWLPFLDELKSSVCLNLGRVLLDFNGFPGGGKTNIEEYVHDEGKWVRGSIEGIDAGALWKLDRKDEFEFHNIN